MPAVEPLRIRHFRTLWVASLVGYMGSFLHTVAASWLMLELTGSAAWVGLMAGSSTLPVLLLALPAGVVADIADRRKVLFGAHALMAASAFAMAAMWFLDLSSPGRLLGLGLLLGAGVAFNLPVSQAIVPDLVPRGLVADAVALNSAGFNVARALGPTLGGVVVALAGPGIAFALNALSYVGVVLAARSLRGTWRTEQESSVASAIAIGLRYVRFTPPFGHLLTIVASFAVTSAALQAILPNVTADALGGGPGTYGLLLGAMGAGALGGTAARHRARRLLGDTLVPIAIVAVGIAGIVVGLSTNLIVTGLAMLVAGVAWIWVLVTLAATAQLLAPTWVRGRVMSLYSMVYPGGVPLGAILAGVLGDVLGPGFAMATLSGATVLLGVLTRGWAPRLSDRAPDPTDDDGREELHQPERLHGGPVMVTNQWLVGDDDLVEFLHLMDRLRVLRLRSGAYRWRLYRGAGDPRVLTEVFLVRTWDDHLRQHRRTDRAAAALIDRTRALDHGGGPLTHHMVALDVTDHEQRPTRFDELAIARDGVHDARPPGL